MLLALILANVVKMLGLFRTLDTTGLTYTHPAGQGLMDTIVAIFPSNPITPLANATMLQVIVISLLIGFGATAISAIVGIPLGAIAADVGGKAENIIMRLVELLLMIPNMLLTIVIVAITGINLRNLVICFGIATIPHFARNARAAVMTVMGNEYIEAAKALGVKDWVIIVTHILPNALSPILVQATSRIGGCIVGAAGFSFLGLGVPVPTPEWGAMLNEAKGQMRQNPYLVLFPGLAIFVTVLAVNMIGDGLRDALDPKLKR